MFRLNIGLCIVILAGLLAGCGQTNQTPAKARGAVRYNGQPLKGGNVIFHSSDKGSYKASISQDGNGTYEVVDLPTGELDVTIETEFLKPNDGSANPQEAQRAKKSTKSDAEYSAAMEKMKGTGAVAPVSKEALAGRYTKIPPKYTKKGTSKLTVTVERGWNDRDFDLVD